MVFVCVTDADSWSGDSSIVLYRNSFQWQDRGHETNRIGSIREREKL